MNSLDLEDVKDDLRERLIKNRDRRSAAERQRCADRLAAVVLDQPAVRDATCVAGYVSVRSEPGSEPLLSALRANGVTVLLPVLGQGLTRGWAIDNGPDHRLDAAPGRPPEPLSPDLGAGALAEANVIITPALAVDSSGTRLGQGGGWYDRALRSASPHALIVALVYDDEYRDHAHPPLPREEHDHLVHAVATPERWIDIRPLPH